MKIPPYQDIRTLTANLCISESTVVAWIEKGLLPKPAVTRGGKRLWKWSQVEQYLDAPEVEGPEAELEEITNETRKQASNAR